MLVRLTKIFGVLNCRSSVVSRFKGQITEFLESFCISKLPAHNEQQKRGRRSRSNVPRRPVMSCLQFAGRACGGSRIRSSTTQSSRDRVPHSGALPVTSCLTAGVPCRGRSSPAFTAPKFTRKWHPGTELHRDLLIQSQAS